MADHAFEETHCLTGHKTAVSSLEFSPDNDQLASASGDCTVKIWNFREGKLIRTLQGKHRAGVNDLSWDKRGQLLCSGSDDGTIVVWDTKTGKPHRVLKGHTKQVFSVCFNKTSAPLIVSGGFDNEVRIWNVRSGKLHKKIPGHTKPVTSVDFSADGKLVASSSLDGLCRVWDAENGGLLVTLAKDNGLPISSARFSPNGKFLLTSELNGEVNVWDIRGRKCKRSFKGHKNTKYCTVATTLPVKKGGKVVAKVVSGSEDGHAYIWDIGSPLVAKLKHSDNSSEVVLSVACHSEGFVATGSLNQPVIKLWKSKENPEDKS